MQPAAHSHGASLSESRVPAQLITIVVPGRAVANAMMQRLGFISPQRLCVRPCVPSCPNPFRAHLMTIRANVPPPIPEGEMRARERGRGVGVRPDEVVLGIFWPPTRSRRCLSLDGRA